MQRISLNYQDLENLPYGARVTITSLDGWDSSPEPKGDAVEMAAADGDVQGVQHYHARFIELAGRVQAPDHDSLHQIGTYLTGLVPHGGCRLEVEGHGATMWAHVFRASAFRFSTVTDTLAVFSVTLKAPDPCKYGVTRRFPESGTSPAGTSVEVFHEGNYGAAPKITVQGYSPGGFTAFGTGSDRFRVTEGVNTGETLVADFKVGHVFLNGVRKPAAGGYRSLARIRPYELRATNVIPAQPDVASNVRFFVEVTDTWI